MTLVYVEHPRKHLLNLALEFGCEETNFKSSGNWYTFPDTDKAINFIWRIRNMPTRYVEIHKDMKPALVKFVKSKGFSSNIKGLVSKVLP